jgi:hypothetical protein
VSSGHENVPLQHWLVQGTHTCCPKVASDSLMSSAIINSCTVLQDAAMILQVGPGKT